MSDKDGGYAFPGLPIDYTSPEGVYRSVDGGMTLRDYFAAKALQGLLASPRAPMGDDGKLANPVTDHLYAKVAYIAADAMLKERAK